MACILQVYIIIFNDNLTWNKNLKIPSNYTEFFIFKKHWEFSQLIVFDINNVFIENIYCIIQSYLNNKALHCTGIFTCQINAYGEKKILSYQNIFIVKKMNFFFFKEWWENLSDYDKKYISENDTYALLIKFSKPSFINLCTAHPNEDPYSHIKPLYPWNKSIEKIIKVFK